VDASGQRLVNRRILLGAGLGSAAAGLGLSSCSAGESTTGPRNRATASDELTSALPTSRGGVLVAYFSRAGENYWYGGRRSVDVGFTEILAGMIGERIECDTYRIEPADPYPTAYEPTVERNGEEQQDDARPRIAGRLPDLGRYDTVLLGSPVWNVRAPMIMSTFVESVDLSGKRVLPFVTYAVSGMAGIDEDYRDVLAGAQVSEGLAVRGETVRQGGPDLDAWLTQNL
jgi:flavodoxin